jgi:Helicase conserved C-terminal domain
MSVREPNSSSPEAGEAIGDRSVLDGGPLFGRPDTVQAIHGGVRRADRRAITEEFTKNPACQVLLATDAAGEGLNLQAAHLMVNYDLPWNPNRIEQRFGRIHRIGQTEVCRLRNLVAANTREGEVFTRLLQKIEEQRKAYGGKVFDVLGSAFDETPLRELLIEAIRYGDLPETAPSPSPAPTSYGCSGAWRRPTPAGCSRTTSSGPSASPYSASAAGSRDANAAGTRSPTFPRPSAP